MTVWRDPTKREGGKRRRQKEDANTTVARAGDQKLRNIKGKKKTKTQNQLSAGGVRELISNKWGVEDS